MIFSLINIYFKHIKTIENKWYIQSYKKKKKKNNKQKTERTENL